MEEPVWRGGIRTWLIEKCTCIEIETLDFSFNLRYEKNIEYLIRGVRVVVIVLL